MLTYKLLYLWTVIWQPNKSIWSNSSCRTHNSGPKTLYTLRYILLQINHVKSPGILLQNHEYDQWCYNNSFCYKNNIAVLAQYCIYDFFGVGNHILITQYIAISSHIWTICIIEFMMLTYYAFIWVRNFEIECLRGISFFAAAQFGTGSAILYNMTRYRIW